MSVNVLKFGGSSVKNSENIIKVYDILQSQFEDKGKYTLVVSAFGGVTDQLIEMSSLASRGKIGYKKILTAFIERHRKTAKELLNKKNYSSVERHLEENHSTLSNLLNGIYLVREASKRTMDYVLSFGERNSAFIISKALNQRGINSEYLDARKLIVTDKNFGSANVNFKQSNKNIVQHYNANKNIVFVVTGFISADKGGLTTTLGRGGSDYTAAILAGALSSKRLEIWTDVDGVLTCDPRRVKKAFTIESLSYNEAMELSHFGAKVIYPPTIQPALSKKIPIYIRNTFNPSFKGTTIDKSTKASKKKELTGISSLSNIALLTVQGTGMVGIPGVAARLFSSLAAQKINIILITQGSSESSISFAIKSSDQKLAKQCIEETFRQEIKEKFIQPVAVEDKLSIVAIVSEQMKKLPGVAGKLFSSLGKEGVNVIAIAQGSSELNISFVIKTEEEEKALNLIHDAFFLSSTKNVHLFVIGVGLIGGTLLNQIQRQAKKLQASHGIEIKLVALANSKKMLFEKSGLNLKTWKNKLIKSKVISDTSQFVHNMIAMNLPNSIFIDNTANANIPKLYEKILSENISIVTPNKVATSSSIKNYTKLKSIAKKKNVHFLYETNVGAGLPVISTIKNMMASGDKLISLEAVLSGSISYIFNNFSSEKKFSAIVKEAQQLGLTEPDPRDDLNGTDVKRKITILSREAGYNIDMKDVKLSPLLNKACMSAKSVEDFFIELEKADESFTNLVNKAESKEKVLRFIASFKKGKCSVALESVDNKSPFFALEGSDNMIVLTTERYRTRPLIVRGPGAGADVTAAGVFAEIIQIASHTNI
jgi:aspartokinase/homoserine dehydrogenase 1